MLIELDESQAEEIHFIIKEKRANREKILKNITLYPSENKAELEKEIQQLKEFEELFMF